MALRAERGAEAAGGPAARYRELSQFPAVTRAALGAATGGQTFLLYTECSRPDLPRRRPLRFSRHYSLRRAGGHGLAASRAALSAEIHHQLLSQDSPTGQHRAVLSRCPRQGHELLEVWSSGGRSHSVDLTALGKHREVYTEGPFACLAWSHSETRLLYVAEKSRPKPQPPCPWDVPAEARPAEEDEDEEGDQFVYHEDWGEALSTRSMPVLCALDLASSSLSVLEGVPEHLSPGQALWSPGDRGVVFVGWWHEPFRLGLSACSNRRSAIFHLDLASGRCELLSAEHGAACSPRLSPDGRRLLYLEGDLGGPHRQCLRLRMLTWQTRQTVTVLDTVQEPTEAFAGLYGEALPPRCWAADSRRAVLGTPQRSRTDLLLVDTEAATVTNLTAGSPEGCWELLTFQWDLLVATCSAPHRPPSLVSRAVAPRGTARYDQAWHGMTRHTVAWHSKGSMTRHSMARPGMAQDGTAQDGTTEHQSTGTTDTSGPITPWQGPAAQGQGCPGATRCLSPGGGGAATGGPGAAPALGAGGGHPDSARRHLEDPDGPAALRRAEPHRARRPDLRGPAAEPAGQHGTAPARRVSPRWPPRRLRRPLAPKHGRAVPAGLRRAPGELPRLPGLRPGYHQLPAVPRG
ncbi:acylamino-acid-releasing enzyme-like isoform X7 [Nyctibius grandis]|uniref:acylamino-acid-releasing enzyme-like isoform X7 n=1 Tax=Nyctibius grandis TaxID=48427 RepID=UPI0035BC7FDB